MLHIIIIIELLILNVINYLHHVKLISTRVNIAAALQPATMAESTEESHLIASIEPTKFFYNIFREICLPMK